SVDALHRIAGEVGLKQKQFSQCMASDSSRAAVEKDMHEAKQLGVRGTPTFFVNGRALRGASSFAVLKQAIDGTMLGPPEPVARIVAQPKDMWQLLPKSGMSNAALLSPATSVKITPKDRSIAQLRLREALARNYAGAGRLSSALSDRFSLRS